MNDLDHALFDAWNRTADALKRDRVKAAARHARRFTPTLSRPLRPFCLALRASDTRLDPLATSAIHPELSHEIELTADDARRLTKPVDLPWPGIDWTVAARRLGRSRYAVGDWIRRGVVEVDYANGRSCGKPGRPVPHVWSRTVLDPGADGGCAPDPVFGSLWRYLSDRIPEGLWQTLERTPYPEKRADGSARMPGFYFVCPGRVFPGPAGVRLAGGGERENEDGSGLVTRACGRVVRKLYLPTPVWTVAHAMSLRAEFDVEGLSGPWIPGAQDPVLPFEGGVREPVRTFACRHCWEVACVHVSGASGWNTVISHLSAGLLYGHEVERVMTPRRRRAYPARRRPAGFVSRSRKYEAGRLFCEGLTHRRVGERLGLAKGTVNQYVHQLHKEFGTHTRDELRAAMARRVGGSAAGACGGGEASGIRH